MPDFADIAEQLSAEQLQQSLANRSQFTQASYFECEDCGDEIPEQRRKLFVRQVQLQLLKVYIIIKPIFSVSYSLQQQMNHFYIFTLKN